MARIEQLKAIEQDVVGILESAGLCLQELGKDKPGSQKAIEAHNQQVLTTLLLMYFSLGLNQSCKVSLVHPGNFVQFNSVWHCIIVGKLLRVLSF